MELAQPYNPQFSFRKITIKIRSASILGKILLYPLKRRTIRKIKEDMGLFLKHTDEILRFDKLHLSRKQLLENAEQAKDIVLRYSDVYDRIERESFFGSGEVKRLADKTLAAFYEVEKQARHLAYSHTDTIPEDESLLEFNAALSQTIFQHANEL